MEPINLWTKPNCVQCNAVKKRLIELIDGLAGLSPDQVKEAWQGLVERDIVVERDLTAPEHAKDLEYFKKACGYSSAPITEFNNHAVPGFIRDEIDNIVKEWKIQLEPA